MCLDIKSWNLFTSLLKKNIFFCLRFEKDGEEKWPWHSRTKISRKCSECTYLCIFSLVNTQNWMFWKGEIHVSETKKIFFRFQNWNVSSFTLHTQRPHRKSGWFMGFSACYVLKSQVLPNLKITQYDLILVHRIFISTTILNNDLSDSPSYLSCAV